MQLKNVPIDQLKLFKKNPKKHPEKQIRLLKKSMTEFGWTSPILISQDKLVIAGHARLQAAKELGLTEVPTIFIDLPYEKAVAYVLADNKLAELAEEDNDIMQEVLTEVTQIPDFDIEAIGFEDSEIEKLLKSVPIPGKVIENESEAPEKVETDIKTGDLFLLGKHRLMCGDCTDEDSVQKLFGGVPPTLYLTDPPYCSGGFQESGKSIGSIGTTAKVKTIANDTLSTRGYQALIGKALYNSKAEVCYIFTDWRMWVNLFDIVESNGFGVRSMIVWDKGAVGMGLGWRSQHELILLGTKIKIPYDKHKAQGNVISCKRSGNPYHPTQKPVELISILLDNTPLEGPVYDSFGGSGTTLVACEQLNRTCYEMELEPRYCQTIINRWEQLTGLRAQRG